MKMSLAQICPALLALLCASSAFAVESPCKEAADKAIAHSKYNGADYQSCDRTSCTYSWQQPGLEGCQYDVNVPLTRNGAKCEAGKPQMDSGSANCP